MDIPADEVQEVVEWCKKIKDEKKTINLVVRNPFKEKFPWARRIIHIEIDTSLYTAKPNNLYYDSTNKKLYMYVNGNWIALNHGLHLDG